MLEILPMFQDMTESAANVQDVVESAANVSGYGGELFQCFRIWKVLSMLGVLPIFQKTGKCCQY